MVQPSAATSWHRTMHAADHVVLCCRLALQAAVAATTSTAADIAAAMEEVQEEWLHLRKSRISCWLRLSLSGPPYSSGTPTPSKLQLTDNSAQYASQKPPPGCGCAAAEGYTEPQGQQRRSSLKRSPLPRVCVVPQPLPEAPEPCIAASTDPMEQSGTPHAVCITPRGSASPALPLFHTDVAGMAVAAGGSQGDTGCPGSDGGVSTVSLDTWGLEGELGGPRHKRRRSVHFSEQANVKRYEGRHAPSCVRGEPEVIQSVAIRSPVKCQVAARKERRGWSVGRPQNVATGGVCAHGSREDEELEEGEVVESCAGEAAPGTDAGMHATVRGGGNSCGDVENESPVTAMLNQSTHRGCGDFGGDLTDVQSPQTLASQKVAHQAEELVRLGRQTMQEGDGPPEEPSAGGSDVLGSETVDVARVVAVPWPSIV